LFVSRLLFTYALAQKATIVRIVRPAAKIATWLIAAPFVALSLGDHCCRWHGYFQRRDSRRRALHRRLYLGRSRLRIAAQAAEMSSARLATRDAL